MEDACRDYAHWTWDTKELDGLWSLAHYGSEPLTRLIHKIKYQSKDWALKAVMPAFRASFPVEEFREIVDLVLPVPLHPSRLRQRGFNQASLIGTEVAAWLGKPLREDILLRTKPTKAQMKLEKREDRRKNVSEAFAVQSGGALEGKRILLLDDVYTSGSTMGECAKNLRQSGAFKIFGLTLARSSR